MMSLFAADKISFVRQLYLVWFLCDSPRTERMLVQLQYFFTLHLFLTLFFFDVAQTVQCASGYQDKTINQGK